MESPYGSCVANSGTYRFMASEIEYPQNFIFDYVIINNRHFFFNDTADINGISLQKSIDCHFFLENFATIRAYQRLLD